METNIPDGKSISHSKLSNRIQGQQVVKLCKRSMLCRARKETAKHNRRAAYDLLGASKMSNKSGLIACKKKVPSPSTATHSPPPVSRPMFLIQLGMPKHPKEETLERSNSGKQHKYSRFTDMQTLSPASSPETWPQILCS